MLSTTSEATIRILMGFAGCPTLKDIGITKAQSSKWQKSAAMPEEKFDRSESKTTLAQG